jgi:hypothetical protein
MKSTQPTTTDLKLRELIGTHAARRLGAPIVAADSVAPVGLTPADEAELETLLQLANPSLDGDEQAAIERLVSVLETAPTRA